MNFLRLTNRVINLHHVAAITKYTERKTLFTVHPEYYKILLTTSRVDGFILFGCGYMDGTPSYIEVCKKNDPVNFEIVSKWMEKGHTQIEDI